jgi:hypothetical protein
MAFTCASSSVSYCGIFVSGRKAVGALIHTGSHSGFNFIFTSLREGPTFLISEEGLPALLLHDARRFEARHLLREIFFLIDARAFGQAPCPRPCRRGRRGASGSRFNFSSTFSFFTRISMRSLRDEGERSSDSAS